MTDREAFLRAVVADPDSDLARLVCADWLEDHGESDYGAFIRAQVELAHSPAWEPFAVRCRHREALFLRGAPFQGGLPRVDGHALEWHPDHAFRRGFGWGLIVRDMVALFENAPRLFDAAPIGQLHLPTATLGDWKRFAAQPWLLRVHSLRFYGTRTPIEPIRALCDSVNASTIEELVFDVSGRPGMPELMRGLLQSPLGRQLRRLELHAGPDEPDELLGWLGYADPAPRLERLALHTMGAGWIGLDGLYDSPVVSQLAELELVHVPGATLPPPPGQGLARLVVRDCRLASHHFQNLNNSSAWSDLRSLDLGENTLESWHDPASRAVIESTGPRGLRSLGLRRTGLRDAMLSGWLCRTQFWSRLVELDLRDNWITDRGASDLLRAPVPPDLTALCLEGNAIGEAMAQMLRQHFGDAVIL